MKKSVKVWVIGGLVAVSIFGFGMVTNIGSAADSTSQATMMQGGNMDPKAMADMMKTPEFQQRCIENMKSPEMQQSMMMMMMKQPEMQAAMKQMLQKDAGFHQMMLDLVNSVDMNMDHGNMTTDPTHSMPGMDHSAHH